MIEETKSQLNAQLSAEIQAETSRLLRQGRNKRKLSVAQAANALEMSPFLLKALEAGTVQQSVNLVSRALTFYGFDELVFHDLFQNLMLEKNLRQRESKRRAHLSVPGENPKPWENCPTSLSEALKRSAKGLNL